MKIYVASSWRNQQQPDVVRALRDAGHEVYDFKNPQPGDKGFGWSEIDPDWKAWTAADQIKCYEHPAAVRGLKNDFDAMKWADALVMVQPCGRSAALELGWAIGAGKKTLVLMVDGQEPELMIRLAGHLCLSIDEVLDKLTMKESKTAPLSCDCYGGCWGDHSEGWPSVKGDEAIIKRAYVACHKVLKLPYGSYVLMTGELRLQTPELRQRVEAFLATETR